MRVLALGVRDCSESLGVPGAMAGQGTAPQDKPPRFQGGDVLWGHSHRAAGAARQRELILHLTDGAETKRKAKQESRLEAD